MFDSFGSLAALFNKRRPVDIVPLIVLTAITAAGCRDDSQLIRQIQSRQQASRQDDAQQDHLGETTRLLSEFALLNREKATRQIIYHVNQWNENQDAIGDASDAAAMPKLAATLDNVVPPEALADTISRETFQSGDVTLLRDAYLFRRLVQWSDSPIRDDPLLSDWFANLSEEIGAEPAGRLQTAARLFDWTVRNVALEPRELSLPPLDPPEYPLGMTWEGAGYRQTDFQTLFRGRGDSRQRAGVFTQLCIQAGIPAAVLATQSEDTGELTPWCVGVLIGERVYLFEPELGMFVPGPDQIGIATLKQARDDVTVMRRLNVAGYFDYPLSKFDIAQNVALLNLRVEMMAPRMSELEQALVGDRRLTLYQDVDALAKDFDAVSGIAGVRLWEMSTLAEVYRVVSRKHAERDPRFHFWLISRWAILESENTMATNLRTGRWRHLTGRFADDEVEGDQGARHHYMEQRAPEFEIEDLRIDVDLQKQYGLRRGLGVDSEQYDQQLQQIQTMLRLGKRTATYWLALVQYDDGRAETAGNWFGKRVLDKDQRSMWEEAARYNLARCYEKTGRVEDAIALLKNEDVISRHGNRLRARLVDDRLRPGT